MVRWSSRFGGVRERCRRVSGLSVRGLLSRGLVRTGSGVKSGLRFRGLVWGSELAQEGSEVAQGGSTKAGDSGCDRSGTRARGCLGVSRSCRCGFGGSMSTRSWSEQGGRSGWQRWYW